MNEWLWIGAALLAGLAAILLVSRIRRRFRRMQAVMEQRAELRNLSMQFPIMGGVDEGPVYPLVSDVQPGGEVMLGWNWLTVRPPPAAGLADRICIPWAEVLHVYSGIGDRVYIVMEEGEKLALPFNAGRDVWARIRKLRSETPRHSYSRPSIPGTSVSVPASPASAAVPHDVGDIRRAPLPAKSARTSRAPTQERLRWAVRPDIGASGDGVLLPSPAVLPTSATLRHDPKRQAEPIGGAIKRLVWLD